MVAKVSTATVAQFKLSDDEVAVLESAYELIDTIHSTLNQGEIIVSKTLSNVSHGKSSHESRVSCLVSLRTITSNGASKRSKK